MANLTEIADDVKIEEGKLDDNFRKQVWICISIFVVVLIGLSIAYGWNYPKFIFCNTNWNLDAERFGQFGDFFGGVIGSIITLASFFFLYKAFREQRLANVETRGTNKKIIEQNDLLKKQDEQHLYWERLSQFDTQFNTLLSLYEDSLDSYQNDDKQCGRKVLNQKVASYIASTTFDNSDGYTKRVQAASSKFNGFIIKHRTLINAHMRLFYQLLILLDTPFLEDNSKIIYLKILRSQLTDEELILIRYNCWTKRGQKMQMPVFRYNILKHLPFLDLFEFKKYKQSLNSSQANLLSDELIVWRKNICSLFRQNTYDEESANFEKKYGKRYFMSIKVSCDKKNYEFSLKKTPRIPGRNYEPLIPVLDKFPDEDLENLLIDFHTEIFRHIHFRMFNRQKLSINHSFLKEENDTIFAIKVSCENPIIVSYSQIQEPGN